MLTTVLALGAVVVLALAYAALSERLEYGSLSRRRLDVLAFVGGLACLGAMLFGGGDVHQTRRLSVAGQPPAGVDSSPVVTRRRVVSLHTDGWGSAEEPGSLLALAGDQPEKRAEAVVLESPGASSSVADRPYVALRGTRRPAEDSVPAAPAVEASSREVVARGVFTPAVGIVTPMPSAPWIGPVVIVPTPTPLPAAPTDRPPEPRQPTAAPDPWATPTPFCGDPRAIVLDLDVLDASLELSGGAQAVRYRAQVHNRSTFPVRLRDITVTLEGRDNTSERFGVQRLSDVEVEPSVVHALEGLLTLEKSPSPFGSAQLCVSLVTETCGQSLPYHATKRCIAARGF